MKDIFNKKLYIFLFIVGFFMFADNTLALTCEYNLTEASQNANVNKIKFDISSNSVFKIYEDNKIVCDGGSDMRCSASYAVAKMVDINKCFDYITRNFQSSLISYSAGTVANHNYTLSTLKEVSCSFSARKSGYELVAVRCINDKCTLRNDGNVIVFSTKPCDKYRYLNYDGSQYLLTDDPNSTHISYLYKQDLSKKVSCMGIDNIPIRLPNITSKIVNIIKIIVPVILIVIGMVDIAKSVMSQKDDEIKKGQKIFIKRLTTAALIFFVIVITQTIINLVAGNEAQSIIDCMNCFLNNKC
ncbi:MAG TPA: hypothetical protein GX747_03905 [Tenericutes bacterium]|nr:hypothetical protein [Mycoplasmatota bacterium]